MLSQLNSLKSLCMVVGIDYRLIIHEIHQSLDDSCGPKSISEDTIERLSATINRLEDVKIQRLQRVGVNVIFPFCFIKAFYLLFLTLVAFIASRSCHNHGRALEFDGYTS